jgi:hypothetical protein
MGALDGDWMYAGKMDFCRLSIFSEAVPVLEDGFFARIHLLGGCFGRKDE